MSLTFGELSIRLALGELKHTSYVDKEDKSMIKAEERLTLSRYVNQGLDALFSKFILLEKELILRTVRGYSYYYLRSEFAMSDLREVPYKYIDDLELPKFTDDIVKILTVYDEFGCEVDRDQPDNPGCSVFTPQFDTLQVMPPRQGRHLHVMYQAKHPDIGSGDPRQQIRIPPYFEEALQLYVAGKALSHMNSAEHSAKGQEYLAMFQAICADVESKDLASTSFVREGTKLRERGFA